MMQVAVGTSQRVSNGLKQSTQKPRAAQYCPFTESFPTEQRSKELREGETHYYTKALGWVIPWEPGCH